MTAVRCSCYLGLPDVSTARHADATTPEVCPVHGQRNRDAAPGGRGVPVIDLSTTVADLRTHARVARLRIAEVQRDAELMVDYLTREATYLDSLADALDGNG